MVRVCIIGISGFGTQHYNDLIRESEAGRWTPVAATVINQDEEVEKCAKLREHGCKLYTDYHEMLANHGSEADLCMIPTGIHMHAPMSIAAMRAGVNVFVEKPAAARIEDVQAMQAVESETGKFVAVGYQSMYGDDVQQIKAAILGGQIGAIQSIRCKVLWPRYDSYYARNAWAGRVKVGDTWVLDSPFNNAMAHYLNLICFFGGSEQHHSADATTVDAELYRAHDIESCDTANLKISTKQNIPLQFICTHASVDRIGPIVEVRGERGTIHWSGSPDAPSTIVVDGKTVEEVAPEDGMLLRGKMRNALTAKLTDPQAFTCTLDIAGAQTRCSTLAFDTATIHTIAANHIRREPCEDSVKTMINGIEQVIDQCFETGQSFAEAGAPWVA